MFNSEYQVEKIIKFPNVIFEQINKAEDDSSVNSFTGMFPPLNLIYFVKNEIIYFWDYEQNQIYTFKEIQSVILYIYITKPKSGIFAPDVIIIFTIIFIQFLFFLLAFR